MTRTFDGVVPGFARLRVRLFVVLLLLVCAPVALPKRTATTRSVEGAVSNPDDSAVSGAVVQLKNMKTLQIRSFITKEDGTYHFFELSPDVDYELKADFQGARAATRRSVPSIPARRPSLT